MSMLDRPKVKCSIKGCEEKVIPFLWFTSIGKDPICPRHFQAACRIAFRDAVKKVTAK